jgi:hypothetical protein
MTTIRPREKTCLHCGALTTKLVLCARCYRTSAAGKNEDFVRRVYQSYKPQQDGGPCKQCIHWEHRCLLGFPEGGTLAAVDLCSARQLDSLLE